jgi:hypothetical protein
VAPLVHVAGSSLKLNYDKQTGQIFFGNECFKPSMDWEIALSNQKLFNLDKEERRQLFISAIHARFLRVLDLYCSGSAYRKLDRILYPCLNRFDPLFIKYLKEITSLFLGYANLEERYDFEKDVKMLQQDMGCREMDPSILICRYYDLFSRISFLNENKQCTISIASINPDDYTHDSAYLKPILDLLEHMEELKNDLVGFYIFGSMATLDYVRGFSDLDALIILKDETMRCAKKLQRVAKKLRLGSKYLYQIDPLQHHCFFVLTEMDLRCHNTAIFPIELLQNMRALDSSKKVLKVRPRDTRLERLKAFWEHVQFYRRIYCQEVINNLYDYKCYIHWLLMLPTIYLQAIGISCYKRDSFEIIKDYFSGEELTIINHVSYLRNKWPAIFPPHIWIRRPFLLYPNPRMLGFVQRFFMRNIPKEILIDRGRIGHDALVIAHRMLLSVNDYYEKEWK